MLGKMKVMCHYRVSVFGAMAKTTDGHYFQSTAGLRLRTTVHVK